MIIHTTTLSTLSQVQAIYGSNTTWIQHSGYILRGASSAVTANSAVKDGGEDTHTLTINEIPSHNHSADDSTYGMWRNYVDSSSGSYSRAEFSKASAVATPVMTTSTGGGAAHNIMQSYKNVYIWERTA